MQLASAMLALKTALCLLRQWRALGWGQVAGATGVVAVSVAPLVSACLPESEHLLHSPCQDWLAKESSVHLCRQSTLLMHPSPLPPTTVLQLLSEWAPLVFQRWRLLLLVTARHAQELDPAAASLYAEISRMGGTASGLRQPALLLVMALLSRCAPESAV